LTQSPQSNHKRSKPMKLTNEIHVVGGGRLGFGISGPLDCHAYLVNGGTELALIDPGMGLPGDFDLVLENIRADGLDPAHIRTIILTHYHCDHIGAAAEARTRLNAAVIAAHDAAAAIRTGDEYAVALDVARRAGFYLADYVLPPCPVDQAVREGDTIRVGNLTLNVWETPGHIYSATTVILSRSPATHSDGGAIRAGCGQG
jgi:hydroxyacylglutathione hydrolase